jgi:hypothetical protein
MEKVFQGYRDREQNKSQAPEKFYAGKVLGEFNGETVKTI